MWGVVDVGGGTRGAYGAGVLDACLDAGIAFDLCVGVSAGAANEVSYMAGQRGRNLRFYTEYQARPAYMGAKNLLRTGSYLNLEYVYGGLTNSDGEDPLDFPAMMASGIDLAVVATNALTGAPAYFGLDRFAQDDYGPLKASSCLPVANRPWAMDGVPYFDGGVADPIPVDYALGCGCERVVLILTRPRAHWRTSEKDWRLSRLLRRRWPAAAEALATRARMYNLELARALELEREGRVLVVAPPDEFRDMPTLVRDEAQVRALYDQGIRDAARIRTW